MNKFYFSSVLLGLALVAFAVFPVKALALIDTSLFPGSTGAEVRELQTFLRADATIYPEGLVTGFYGPLTQKAVERFQIAQNIVSAGTPETTGFGQVGPITRAKINSLMGTGGAETDITAPIMTQETVSTTTTGATISWITTEDAFSRVMYSKTFPFLYASAASTADPSFDKNTTVTISGLDPKTTYFYVRESKDLAGNIMWTEKRTFSTQ